VRARACVCVMRSDVTPPDLTAGLRWWMGETGSFQTKSPQILLLV